MNSVLRGFFVTFNLQGALQSRPSLMLLLYTRVFVVYKLPPQNAQFPPPPPKKILLSLQYTSNYTGKIVRRDVVSAHTAKFLKIVSQNAPDCISGHIHFKDAPGVYAPGPPPGKLVAFGHSGLKHSPPNDKS